MLPLQLSQPLCALQSQLPHERVIRVLYHHVRLHLPLRELIKPVHLLLERLLILASEFLHELPRLLAVPLELEVILEDFPLLLLSKGLCFRLGLLHTLVFRCFLFQLSVGPLPELLEDGWPLAWCLSTGGGVLRGGDPRGLWRWYCCRHLFNILILLLRN